ncbi:hypothetical protein [Pseudomonas phage PASB7]|nr:hypothetical protein [Pseudomonas phage PASB7]
MRASLRSLLGRPLHLTPSLDGEGGGWALVVALGRPLPGANPFERRGVRVPYYI